MKIRKLLSVLLLLAFNHSFAANIIPLPAEMKTKSGNFELTVKTLILYDKGNTELKHLAEYYTSQIQSLGGPKMQIRETNQAMPQKNAILITLKNGESKLGKEGYFLDVSQKTILLNSVSGQGIFYGIQTLFQLLPAIPGKTWPVECIEIRDYPHYSYRGLHLDVSRHIFPVAFVMKYIDMMAMYKFNTFHWHLTDDQGWRIEIKKYPNLTQAGAWRKGTQIGKQDSADNKPYGGYFTQEEIKDIVKYAADRYVNIIPEIEMPGHAIAALTAYPRFSCLGKPFDVLTSWGVAEDVFCAGNDSTFSFLEDILDEVITLFPYRYIHIGGDECPKNRWHECPKCQARIKTEGLKDETALQGYFTRRIEKYLNAHQRSIIGWDEILEGGITPSATVMSWRGVESGIDAARQGHDVIMTPGSHCYFDYYQADPAYEPLAIGGFTNLQKVYSFEPTPDVLTPEEAKHILGAQANLWTEYVDNSAHVEYMIYPRALALSEVNWSPKSSRNWDLFVDRLNDHFKRMEINKINFCKSLYDAQIGTVVDTTTITNLVTLKSDWKNMDIHYTINGQEPTIGTPLYQKPFAITSTSTIKAGVFDQKIMKGRITQEKIYVNLASGKPVKVLQPFSKQYPGKGDNTMTNGLKGNLAIRADSWQGYSGNDMEVIIDLGESKIIHAIESSYLKSSWSWIFLPKSVEYSLSEDGVNFQPAGTMENLNDNKHGAELRSFRQPVNSLKARYVKVKAINVGVCPSWHGAAGQPAWLFADEVIVE